jgi:5-methylcytosine-specific restriction endonuclease McrA
LEGLTQLSHYFNSKSRDLISASLIFRWINENWPTYPPDWSVRRRAILTRAEGECEACGEYEDTLDIHHKTSISKGGTHSFNNLICLCRKCHEEEHEHQIGEPLPTSPRPETIFARRIRLINQAMAEKRDIAFHYRDFKKKETDRIVTPQALTRPGRGLCVSGYCHLRNAMREFNIRRMSKLELK